MSNKDKTFSRRKFLIRAAIGTSVMIGAGIIGCNPLRRTIAKSINGSLTSYDIDFGPKTWFEVKADNTVIVHTPKVEMGQGIFTGYAQLVADELSVDIKNIKIVHANSADRPVDPRGTGNSDSLSALWQPLRELAAKMREMLRNNAATILGVPATQLSIENSVISGNGKTITYGEVIAKATEWEVPKEVTLKKKSDYKYIGKAVPRVDLKEKVIGTPIYGIDATMPDMLYGGVMRPTKIDSKRGKYNIAKAEAMADVVKVVVEADFIGVVAKSQTAVILAKKAIEIEWIPNKKWNQADIEAMVKVGEGNDVQIQKEGNAKSILKDDNIIELEYTSPIGAHAQIEPNGAVAYFEGDKVTIKMSTQVVKITQEQVAERLGMKAEDIHIQPMFLGGGFGRRLNTPNAVQAAVLSKAVGKPVHVFFSRKEEFQHDFFRPPTHHVLKAKLDNNGMIEAIEHNLSSGDVAFGSPMVPGYAPIVLGADLGAWRGGMIQYTAIPNYRAISWRVKLPFATSWWRGLGLLANTFAIESFMDELAHKTNKDAVQFRLEQIKDDADGKRLKNVIKAAAEKSGWGKSLLKGRALGFAASVDVTTPVAQVVELSIENKAIKIHKVTCAIDPGLVINPDGVKAQCEGAIIMGMSAAIYEKMEIKDNELGPTIYGDYQMALMKNAPKEIDIVLLESTGRPSGVGEPPIGPIGAAIANAVFNLTGKRLRNMPLRLD